MFEKLNHLYEWFDNLNIKMMHAWFLACIAIGYVAWAAPLALQSLVLVAGKVWIGALVGYWLDKAVFSYARPDHASPIIAWMFRRCAVMSAFILGFALGV